MLDKGLTFIPTYRRLPLNCIYAAQHRLVRNLKLRDYFQDKQDDEYDYRKKTFTNPSIWTPTDDKLRQSTLNTIQKIVTTTESVIRQLKIINGRTLTLHGGRDNLTPEERAAIRQLRNNHDVIIKPADKGAATVIMNRSAYIAEAHRQLDNTTYYQKLDGPIFQYNIPKINEILEDMTSQHFISSKQLAYLRARTTDRPRTFYLLPKIHKPRHKWPQPNVMPEGRPIVSDCGSESYRISEYIDSFIRPISTRHMSYIKDTYDFVNKIRNQRIPKGAFLVTGDVSALYTNMRIDRTLATTRRALQKHPASGRPDGHLLRLLELTLRNNDFTFDGQFYLQVCGTAMGKNYAPGLADIYMEDFDEGAVNGYHIIPLLYGRYLDDFFFIWTGTTDELRDFEHHLNSLIDGIKVTLNWSQESIDFLDTTVYKRHENNDDHDVLLTKVFFKQTDTHQLLHKSSFHPPHTTRGVLKSQLLRFKRISSTFVDYDVACKILFGALAKRNYSRSLMRKMKRDIWNGPTTTVNAARDTTKLLPIVVPYNHVGTRLAHLWKTIIQNDQRFDDLRLITAYTTGSNLRRQLVRSSLTQPTAVDRIREIDINIERSGCTRCNNNKCKACNYITPARHFRSTTNNRSFTVTGAINCKSRNTIYLVTCKKCGKQYVGETSRPLADRINNHLSYIRTRKNTPTGLHFNGPGHNIQHFSIIGIEKFDDRPDTTSNLLMKEDTWQTLLQTRHPLGINNLKPSLMNR